MKIAVIPARGGSKRIPRKNIRSFFGRPILSYAIQSAQDSGLFDHVVVSTDDDEIAQVAKDAGAEVPFLRPAKLADDFTGTNGVVRHAIGHYVNAGDAPDYACCIYATAPLLQSAYLRMGFEALQKSEKSFCFSVTTFASPIQRALRVQKDGSLQAIYPENRDVRSQDLDEAYHDAAQFYWGTRQAFIEDVPLFSEASVPLILPRYLVQDIDTEEDWRAAEALYDAFLRRE